MNDAAYSRLAATISNHERDILKEWLDAPADETKSLDFTNSASNI